MDRRTLLAAGLGTLACGSTARADDKSAWGATVAAAGLALPVAADPAGREPLAPEQAWRKEAGATITIRFQVRKDYAVADEAEGEIHLVSLVSGGLGGTSGLMYGGLGTASASHFRVVVTNKCRKDFARIGVTKLGDHFAGRDVTVKGQVTTTNTVTTTGQGFGGGDVQRSRPLTIVAVTIDSLDQFVSVR